MNVRNYLYRLVPILVFGWAASAQGASDGPPLFASQDVVDITLEAPIKKLGRDDKKETWFVGKLSTGGQDFDVEYRARGKFRLDLCRMPPLWVKFDKKQVDDTVFDKQKRLKVVPFCRDNDRYEELVVLEYLIYRIYNLFTDESYRVRPARITYVEAENGKASDPRFSILLEHKRLLNKRLDSDSLDADKINATDQNPDTASLLELFQFMIGNTDWSSIRGPQGEGCCHNVHLFIPAGESVGKGKVIPVAYDFDQTGFVNPPYAEVNEDLGIRSVKDRLYRGWCRDADLQERNYAQFAAQKGAIETMIRDQEGLSDRTRKRALKWMADFYTILETPKKRAREIDEECRG